MSSFRWYVGAAAMGLVVLSAGASAASGHYADTPATQDDGRFSDATTNPQIKMATVPTGTELLLALDAPLNSKTNKAGDTFTARVMDPVVVNGRTVVPAGAKVAGQVTEAVAAKRGMGKGKLALKFDQLRLPSGYRANIVGTFQEVSASNKKKNAETIGGGAIGGAIVGRIFGKGTKSAVVGSIIGGAAGTAVVMSKEGQQASLNADKPFKIKLDQPIEVPS